MNNGDKIKINFAIVHKYSLITLLFVIAIGITYFAQKFAGRISSSLQIFFLTFIILYFSLKFKSFAIYFKAIATGAILAVVFLSLYWIYGTEKSNFTKPNEWDFLCFYMDGKVAANGLNFYKPENYAKVYENIKIPFTPGPEFIPETINVGFQYLPPNIFIFLPLGYFDFSTAQAIWAIINFIFLFSCIYLVWKIFIKKYSTINLLLVLGLFFLLPGTRIAIGYEHNTFILMFPLLLAWKYKDKAASGIWLAVGICLKPLLAVVFVFPLLRKKWKTIIYYLLALVFLSLITTISFGTETFFEYFKSEYISRMPSWVYLENVNQSLLSTILRITGYFEFSNGNPLFHPLFLITAAVISGISFYFIYKLKDGDSDLGFAITIILSLLIYPGSINSYSPLVIPVTALLVKYSLSEKHQELIFILTISFIYGSMSINPFISHITLWLFVIGLAAIKTGLLTSKIFTLFKTD